MYVAAIKHSQAFAIIKLSSFFRLMICIQQVNDVGDTVVRIVLKDEYKLVYLHKLIAFTFVNITIYFTSLGN